MHQREEMLQALFDGLSMRMQRERAGTQMTLGKLIDALEQMPPDSEVANLLNPHSYRGYYSDLAFELGSGTRRAGELLDECLGAMGRVFEGYKGGEFVMGSKTPVFVAHYGCTGEKLMDLKRDGSIETETDG